MAIVTLYLTVTKYGKVTVTILYVVTEGPLLPLVTVKKPYYSEYLIIWKCYHILSILLQPGISSYLARLNICILDRVFSKVSQHMSAKGTATVQQMIEIASSFYTDTCDLPQGI